MTARLINLVKQEWASFDGSSPSDPFEMRPDRFLNKIYWWSIKNATEQSEIDKFNRRLWVPPPGVVPAPGSPWSAEAETASFGDLASAFGTANTSAVKKASVVP